MLLSTLVMFWFSLNIFREITVSRLWAAVSGSPRPSVDLLLIEQAIFPKYCWKSEAFIREFSLKIMFCKTLQVSQQDICDRIFFRKAVNPYTYDCTSKEAITGVFQWIYFVWIYFLVVSFQSKLLGLNRSDFRTDQYLLNGSSHFNLWKLSEQRKGK